MRSAYAWCAATTQHFRSGRACMHAQGGAAGIRTWSSFGLAHSSVAVAPLLFCNRMRPRCSRSCIIFSVALVTLRH